MRVFIQENGFENVVWKMAAICRGLNVLNIELKVFVANSYNDIGRAIRLTAVWNNAIPDGEKPYLCVV